jgi:soluble lytic murein transglycosylase
VLTLREHRVRFAAWMLIAAASMTLGLPASARAESVAALPAVGAGAAHAKPATLPPVVSEADALRYRKIFVLQEEGRWKDAKRLIDALDDKLLMGHVLAQKYLHPTKYRSRFTELRDWLAVYNDHPQARRIYRLAMRRKPDKARRPTAPVPGYLYGTGDEFPTIAPNDYVPERTQSRAQSREVRRYSRQIRARIRSGWPTGALQILESKTVARLFNTLQADSARADIAMGYFAFHKDQEAFKLAAAAGKRSGRWLATANWTAASPWLRSAGAFWAARASLLTRKPVRYNEWLDVAARHPRTFYGLLARRLLGLETRFDWYSPTLSPVHIRRLTAEPAGRRALALIQVGRRDLADRDLRKLYARTEDSLAEAIVALASHGQLPALAMRLSGILRTDDGHAYDSARYPVPPWQPDGGFDVDRALVLAFARQESNFNPSAKSSAGARGLMQLMPRTASYVAKDRSLRRKDRDRLFDPEFNLDLGQRYLTYLLSGDGVEGDLLLLAAAYNGGPGKLAQWRNRIDHDEDPLLFIESIPSPETRVFIERVLTNLWIYRHRLDQPTPSLDALAMGQRPSYLPLDGRSAAR